MNIAFVIQQNYDLNAGGVQRSTSKLADIFSRNNHNIIVFSLSDKQKDTTIKDLKIFAIKSKKKINQNKLERLIDNYNIEVIINQAGYSLEIAKFLVNTQKFKNFRIISTLRINPLNFISNHHIFISQFLKVRGMSFLNTKLLRAVILKYHRLKQAYELNYIIKHSDAFVLLSERFKQELYEISLKLKKYDDKIYGINNPFEFEKIKLKELDKENVILFVGRLDITQKRTDLLLKIWGKLHHQLPDWKFWVVGHGAEKNNMMRFCKDHQLDRIEFFGKCNPFPFYKKAKLFHMTSAFEGFGNVLVEAQNYACVPVMFNSYSAAQDIVIDEKTGLLITPFDVDEYVEKTIQLINDEHQLNTLSSNAIEHVNNFSYDKTYNKWEYIFKSFDS